MEKDFLTDFFENHTSEIHLQEPEANHTQRFLEKLNPTKKKNDTVKTLWVTLGSIAAGVLIFIAAWNITATKTTNDLASISPEMAKTQDFFTTTINAELKKLETKKTPETTQLINDALKQITLLEKDYEKLKTDLVNSGKDTRVIYAMITNFQNRINILQTVLQQINELKLLKENSYENNTLI